MTKFTICVMNDKEISGTQMKLSKAIERENVRVHSFNSMAFQTIGYFHVKSDILLS